MRGPGPSRKKNINGLGEGGRTFCFSSMASSPCASHSLSLCRLTSTLSLPPHALSLSLQAYLLLLLHGVLALRLALALGTDGLLNALADRVPEGVEVEFIQVSEEVLEVQFLSRFGFMVEEFSGIRS